jgi:hypothetical protein
MSLSRSLFCATLAAFAGLVVASQSRADDEWKPLFNGKDIEGWVVHPKANGAFTEIIAKKEGDKKVGYDARLKDGTVIPLWQIKDGLLIGSGPASHLFTEKDDYTDFHYRIEAKINDKGNSGQYFRAKFEGGFPPGYEAQINATGGDAIKTGSLYPDGRTKLKDFKKDITVMNKAAHGPDEFFTQEVTAIGNKITIKVNGKQTIEFTDPNSTHMKGRFALQGHDPGTVVTFKKIEYKPIAK